MFNPCVPSVSVQHPLNSDPQWMAAFALRSLLLSHLWSCPPRNLSPTQVTFRIPQPSLRCTTSSHLLSLRSLSLGSQTITQVGFSSSWAVSLLSLQVVSYSIWCTPFITVQQISIDYFVLYAFKTEMLIQIVRTEFDRWLITTLPATHVHRIIVVSLNSLWCCQMGSRCHCQSVSQSKVALPWPNSHQAVTMSSVYLSDSTYA